MKTSLHWATSFTLRDTSLSWSRCDRPKYGSPRSPSSLCLIGFDQTSVPPFAHFFGLKAGTVFLDPSLKGHLPADLVFANQRPGASPLISSKSLLCCLCRRRLPLTTIAERNKHDQCTKSIYLWPSTCSRVSRKNL